MTIAIQPLDSGAEMVAVSNIGSIDDAEAMQGGGNDKPLWSTVIRRRRANHQGQGQGIREGATTGNTAPRNSRHRRSTQWLTIKKVRRKFKKRDNGALQWWFLIRGDEADLLVLDQEWEAVQMQTSWKLERCHKPVTQESGEKDTSFLGHD